MSTLSLLAVTYRGFWSVRDKLYAAEIRVTCLKREATSDDGSFQAKDLRSSRKSLDGITQSVSIENQYSHKQKGKKWAAPLSSVRNLLCAQTDMIQVKEEILY